MTHKAQSLQRVAQRREPPDACAAREILAIENDVWRFYWLNP